MFCYHCWSEMVEVVIVDRHNRERKANVCPKCGRTVTDKKDKFWWRIFG